MAERRLIFRVHAVRRMFERSIADAEVAEAVDRGEVIESYPTDTPYPSRLLLAHVGARALHVVAADVPETDETVIITVYEPGLDKWGADLRTRKRA